MLEPYPYPPQRTRTNGLAIAALVLGILSIAGCTGCLTGLPAVICGHIALSQIECSGGLEQGRALAFTGLLLGYISLLASLALVLFLTLTA